MARKKLKIPGKRYRVKRIVVHRKAWTDRWGHRHPARTYVRKIRTILRKLHRKEKPVRKKKTQPPKSVKRPIRKKSPIQTKVNVLSTKRKKLTRRTATNGTKVGAEYIKSKIKERGGWKAIWYDAMAGTSLAKGSGGMKWHFFSPTKTSPPVLTFYEKMGPGRTINFVFERGLDKSPTIILYDWRKSPRGEFIHGRGPQSSLDKAFIDTALQKLTVIKVATPARPGSQGYTQRKNPKTGKWEKIDIATRTKVGERTTPYQNIPIFRR